MKKIMRKIKIKRLGLKGKKREDGGEKKREER